jgi:hypothetical protein
MVGDVLHLAAYLRTRDVDILEACADMSSKAIAQTLVIARLGIVRFAQSGGLHGTVIALTSDQPEPDAHSTPTGVYRRQFAIV